MATKRDYYDILGVPKNASDEEVAKEGAVVVALAIDVVGLAERHIREGGDVGGHAPAGAVIRREGPAAVQGLPGVAL